MRYILTFIISLVLGIVLFFAAVMGLSYSTIGAGSLPDATEITFDGMELTVNGYEWHLPLIGGKLDKKLSTPSNLTVEKLGTLTSAQPVIALPKWGNYGTVQVENAGGQVVFDGSLEEYQAFSYPANGEYKVTVLVWQLSRTKDVEGQLAAFEKSQLIGGFCQNSGLATPAVATGYYRYRFRFNLNATAILTLSSESASVGSAVALQIDGVLEDGVTVRVSTDLGDVTALPVAGGYRAYIPVTYNASSGKHPITVTVGEETFTTSLAVTAISHHKVTLDAPEKNGSADASEEYRNVIWALYNDAPTEKAWFKAWICPVTDYDITMDYSDEKWFDNAFVGYSNCILFEVQPEQTVVAPAAGTVVCAQNLALTGNTIVIDHGHGVRSYLYGLEHIDLKKGDVILQNQPLGTTSESITFDVKIGNKSISPWQLIRGQGGLFWQE